MSILDAIRKKMEESVFCYAKEGGQGFIHKSKCTCDKENNPCQSIIDRNKFHDALKDIKCDDVMKRRNEIVQEIKSQFKDSHGGEIT